MSIIESAIDRKVRLFLEANPLHQFGQAYDDLVWNGMTACTHTCWQAIAHLWTGVRYSLNRINALAGMPKNATTPKVVNGRTIYIPRGMRIEESKTLVAALKLPYVLKTGLPMADLAAAATRGPVLYGNRYGSEPDWRGKPGADGRPNGYARKYGRTQFAGAEDIRHAVLLALVREITDSAGKVGRIEFLRPDPNHGSPARPEKPPYHIISPAQADREYQDIKTVGGSLFAFVPTRSLL